MEELEKTEQIHHIKLFAGIFKPAQHFATLRDADKVKGLALRVVLLSLIMGILAAATAYLTFSLNLLKSSPLIPNINLEQTSQPFFQTFTAISGGIGGLVGVPIGMVILAAIFAIFFRDVPFNKLFAIQAYTTTISFIATLVQLPITILTQKITPFFSLGILGEVLKVGPGLQLFLTSITVFLIWQLYVLITALKQTSRKSANYVTWIVIGLYVVYLAGSAIIAGIGLANAQMGL